MPVVLAAAAALVAGCGSNGSDKAGGLSNTVELRIAAHKIDYFAKLFTDEVRRLSDGRIEIEFIPGRGDDDPPDGLVRYARAVRDGRYDLAVIETPAWNALGVHSFEALEAPFLVDSEPLLKAVLASPLADRMLAGLRAQHVVGLSLAGFWLQHPVGDAGPLRAPSDFRGKRIIVPVSRVNDALMKALGATPVHLSFTQQQRALARHEIDGQEMPAFARPNVWLTANATLSATALSVVANERRFDRLNEQQQRILRTAAAHAARRIAAVLAHNSEAKLVAGHCARGHVVLATRAELAAFQQAVDPVYAQLERDPQVKDTIAAIRELKRRAPPARTPQIPARCSRQSAATNGPARDPSFLDGTYRWRITREGARRLGADLHDPVVGKIGSATLRGGRLVLDVSDGGHSTGTYKVYADRIAFSMFGYTNTFWFKRSADGTLDLTAVLPMDLGDRLVMSSSPWTRVGPPSGNLR
jgi:C4-dicarboxylate-binding protein DctP